MSARNNLAALRGSVSHRLIQVALASALSISLVSLLTSEVSAKITKRQTASARESAVQSAPVSAPVEVAQRTVNLGVGKSIIVDLPEDAAEIFIAKPDVANAVVRSARKLYIVAVAAGQTSIYALDGNGRQIASFQVAVGRDMTELERILKLALPNSNIQPQTVESTIILTGTVDNAGEAQTAVDIAKGFIARSGADGEKDSGKVVNSITLKGRDQVMMKVTVAEVQREVMKQLGVTSAVARGSWGAWTMANPLPLNLQQLSPGRVTVGPLQDLVGSGVGIASQIQAYERQGVARVLAEPTITAVSGESARFMAGGELPVPTTENCVAATNTCTVGVTFKPYGVTIGFTPVVLGEGRILLRVATEVTEIDPNTIITFTSTSVPGFRTRKNETSVELPSGGSIVTAGLLQSTTRQMINGLPGLKDLPVIGALFRSRDYQRHETELMVIVTAYLAKPSRPQDIARPTDGLTFASDPQSVFLGRVNQIYSTTDNPQLIRNFRGRVGFIAD
jgi:pilus assembly protein CpaC